MLKKLISKMGPIVVALASVSLCFIANTSSSSWCYQPSEPMDIIKYKKW